ncbi:MAG: hypothetical protein Q8M16_11690 [Pirellulaceae bacterium]|nr:hypothetical protein [Pirellulaceae bacterium]
MNTSEKSSDFEFTILAQFAAPSPLLDLVGLLFSRASIRDNAESFDGQLVSVLLAPTSYHRGSMHFMHFPPSVSQRMHRHPGSRYLIIFSAIDVRIDYNTCLPESDPEANFETVIVPKNCISVVRFRKDLWHRFSSSDCESSFGAVAFSFHEDDGEERTSENPTNFLERLTVFSGEAFS